MRFAVLGGAGDVGQAVVRDLLEHSDAAIVLADFREGAGRQLAAQLGPRVSYQYTDAARASSVERAVDGCKVSINCIGPAYRFALPVARAVLDAGISGVDICDDSTPVRGLLALREQAARRGLIYLTGVGWTPGITNLLALRASRQLDRTERVDIRWVGSAGDASGRAVIKHLLYCVSGEVPAHRGGERVRVPALSEPERVSFPAPIGELTVAHTGHPEPLTLPLTIDVDHVTVKGTIQPRLAMEAVRLAVRARLTRDDIAIERVASNIFKLGGLVGFATALAPEKRRSAARVDVAGLVDGRRVVLSYQLIDRIAALTAAPVSIAALMLARGAISQVGVFPPEAVLDPTPFFALLAQRGIVVQEYRDDGEIAVTA